MKLNRKDFLSAMKRALPGVESGNVILEGADTFIFDNGFIHSYNDNVSVSIPFPIIDKNDKLVSGALKAKDVYDLVNRFSGDTIKLIPKLTEWIIKNENAVAELTLLESNIIDNVKNLINTNIKYKKIPERFIEGITICQFSSNRSPLAGLFINDDNVIATDEIRINQYTLDSAINGSFWITDSSAKELTKLSNIKKYAISDSWVHFVTEDETIFSCKRLSDEKYPYDKIKALLETHIREKSDISNELPSALIDAVNRAAALSQNIESFDTVKLTFSKDNIEVFSQRPSGKYTEKVDWLKPFKKDIDPVSIYVDYSMIENGIKYSNSFYIKKIMGKEKEVVRIIFTNPNGMQLINTFNGE